MWSGNEPRFRPSQMCCSTKSWLNLRHPDAWKWQITDPRMLTKIQFNNDRESQPRSSTNCPALFNEKVSGLKILPAKGKRAWGFLKGGLSYFMDEEKSVLKSHSRENAKSDILEYSKICEELLFTSIFRLHSPSVLKQASSVLCRICRACARPIYIT